MSRAHPAADSDTMKELILMQAIINAYNLPPKFDLAAKALGITVHAVSGRYSRLKKKVDAAGRLHPLYEIGEDGQPIKRGRGRPPKRPRMPVPDKVAPTILARDDEDDEENEDNFETTIVKPVTNSSKAGNDESKTLVKVEYPSSEDEDPSEV